MLKGEERQLDIGEQDIPVAMIVEELPEIKNYYGHLQYAKKLPKLALVQAVLQYDANNFYVSYTPFDKNRQELTTQESVIFPRTHVFNVLNGATAKAIKRSFTVWQKENLTNCISGYSHGETGTDPEIFVEDGETGQLIPAFEFLPEKKQGKKTGSYYVSTIYWDGFQAEIASCAAACMSYMFDSVHYGLAGILQAAKAKFPKARLSLRNVYEIAPDVLAKTADKHVALGCLPSFNAYDLKGQEMNNGRHLPFRFAGGHIHFGKRMKQDVANRVVKLLDATVGIACVSLFADLDIPIRRQFYGLPGEYRLPTHGLEYRTLSNAWLCHPAIANLVFDLARVVVQAGQADIKDLVACDEQEVIRIIRECDVKQAREHLERNKQVYINLLKCYHGDDTENNCGTVCQLGYETFLNGVSHVVSDPLDVEGNWDLKPNQDWVGHCDGRGKNWKFATNLVLNHKQKV